MLHIPVMVEEVLAHLQCRRDGIYLDATLGTGGHAEAILKASSPDGILLGIDQDGETIAVVRERLQAYGERARFFHNNFGRIDAVLEEVGVKKVDGIVADLGMSSWQLGQAVRGFSFMQEGPLDMRMDQIGLERVEDLLRRTNVQELEEVLRDFGEERHAARIARMILTELNHRPLTTTGLAELVARAYPPKARHGRIHPATRTFQALRIWANREMEALERFLEAAPTLLKKGGRLAVISYHSLEDRPVKHTFRNLCKSDSKFKILTKRPIIPTDAEIAKNPRARSAKLRCLEAIA